MAKKFMAKRAKKKPRSALEKALAILQFIADQPQVVRTADLSAQLGYPRQTAHRVLRQLEELDLVVRPDREHVLVGPRLVKVAFGSLRSFNLSAPIRSALQELVEDIGETCNIGVLDGLDYVYLHRIEGNLPPRLHLAVGSRLEAHCVSGGKVLLAYIEPQQRRRLLASRTLRAVTPRTVTRIGDLERQLRQIRVDGFALNDQEYIKGIVGAAVPVFDRDGKVIAALGLQGQTPRLTVRACANHVPRLKQAADRIGSMWLA
jgi:DNA-binding IclR family transcriptional regulator